MDYVQFSEGCPSLIFMAFSGSSLIFPGQRVLLLMLQLRCGPSPKLESP